MTRASAVLLAFATFVAGCTTKEEKKGSPYPAVTVAGTVTDARGAAVSGAHVVVWNEFDTGSANTAADGTFTVTVDGSDTASYFRITESAHRTREGRVSVGASGAAMGSIAVVSKDEILVSTVAGDVFLAREGHTPIRLTNTSDVERTPRLSRDGLTVRWANVIADTIEEAAFDGTGKHVVRNAEAGYALQAIDWAERGTVAWRTADAGGADDIVLVENPPGGSGGFAYTWTGADPAFSPPAFGWFGPQQINGNMVAFAGGDGIYTAFPYFTNSFFVPEKVTGTLAGDTRPAWSPFRADATLHLGLVRSYRVYLSEVTAGTHTNVYSTPAGLYGNVPGAGGEANIVDFDWAPETVGQPDRIALVVHFLFAGGGGFGTGDVLVIQVDPGTGTVTGGPTVVWDASAQGDDPAGHVAWR